MKKTLSGRSGEKTEHMEYWYCPEHGQILRVEFEVRNRFGKYFAFHKGCGQKLKALTYTKTSMYGHCGKSSLAKEVKHALHLEHHVKARPDGGWMEPDNLDAVLRQ